MDKRRATGSGTTATVAKPKMTRASRQEDETRTHAANLWGIAGRQEVMEMRKLWQLRMPRR
jgi:hypothetical protein